MPYIEQERREKIQNNWMIESPGELNYVITLMIQQYLARKIGDTSHKLEPNYEDYNEVIGVLECAKQELYRKVVSKYEDKKCKENGEVYE